MRLTDCFSCRISNRVSSYQKRINPNHLDTITTVPGHHNASHVHCDDLAAECEVGIVADDDPDVHVVQTAHHGSYWIHVVLEPCSTGAM